jgi:hypothetical protein
VKPTLAERLRDRWAAQKIPIRHGVGPAEIRAFEARAGVAMPPDLRDYFETVDGMERWSSDEEMLEFLHLGAVASVAEELVEFRGIPDYGDLATILESPERYFVFADYMIRSHVYAIRLDPDAYRETPVVGLAGSLVWRAAGSFTEFAEKYLGEGSIFDRGLVSF